MTNKDLQRHHALLHFYRRVRERMTEIDGAVLAEILIREIEAGAESQFLTFIVRQGNKQPDKTDRRIWRIEIESRRYFIVFDHRLNCPVTVLPPNATVTQHRKGKAPRLIHLGAYQ